jgi:hypothetical protein
MSTKTMKQRIALVAVSALTAGFISVVSAPTANALAADLTVEANASAGTAASSSATLTTGKSQGLISGAGAKTDGTGVATMFSNGVLALNAAVATTNTKFTVLTVENGTFSSVASTGGVITTNTIVGANVTIVLGVLATPTAAGTPMVIKSYNDQTAKTAVDVPANLVATLTVTVVPPLSLGATGAAAAASATAPVSFGVIGTPVATQNAQTALMYSAGTLSLRIPRPTTAASKFSVVTVSGGLIAGTTAGTLTGLTTIGLNNEFGFTVRPTAAGTPVVIKYYNDASAATATTGGTLTDTITATVVTTVGTFDASKSFVKINTEATAIATAVLSNSDVADAQVISNGSGGVIAMTLKDSNGVEMPSSTSITAIATGGGVVSADGVTYSTAVTTTYGAAGYANILVAQGVANTPFKPVVSISVNGAAYTSKSFTLQGDIAKVTLSSPTIGLANASSNGTGAFYMSITDSAGNLLAKTASIAPSSLNAAVSAYSATASTEADVVAQTFTCTSATGTANLKYTITNAALATVTSNELAVKCAKAPSTYTASLDKASYAQGSIATLTITAKDSAGNAPADGSKLGTTGASALSITCGALMTAVTLPVTDADTWTSGVKTYKFTVGTTAGSYNCVVDLPLYNSASTPQAAQTIAYAIAGDGSASNSDVLKAIVSLIASINKQIAALQKALLARR